jgi:hypothetical protein
MLSAQKEKEKEKEGKGDGGFKKENLFTGGSITLSFYNQQTVIGADPFFGYKLSDWADVGLAFNFLYSGQRNYYEYNDRVRQTVYGPGIFTRLYPVNFLFAQAQFEHNFTTLKYIPAPGGTYLPDKIKANANSLLLGAGWAQGRQEGSNSFYYISILFDVLKELNSPYVNVEYNPANPAQQRKVMTPVIRAGLNIALFQGRFR